MNALTSCLTSLPLTRQSLSKPTPALGEYAIKVRNLLREKGVESPFLESKEPLAQSQQHQIIRAHLTEILQALGLDLTHPDLAATPDRVAKMYVKEIFSGLDYRHFPEPTFAGWENLSNHATAMVSIGAVEFSSHCMHHLSVMQGKAKMSYFPKKKILGLSKVHRIFSFFAARPQLQELFTLQCLLAFQTILETEDVMVAVRATHGCVRSRGIRDSESITQTLQCGGRFLESGEIRTKYLEQNWD